MLGPALTTINTRTLQLPTKEAEPFYYSQEWRALLAQIIAARGRRCEDPECRTPNGPWSQIYGDHIQEIKDGGAKLDRRNILLRCAPCHGRKTQRERAARAAG